MLDLCLASSFFEAVKDGGGGGLGERGGGVRVFDY